MPENQYPLSDEEFYIEMEKRRIQHRIERRDGSIQVRKPGKLRLDRLAILVLGVLLIGFVIYFSAYHR
jgi:uncharacterized membrane protein